MNMLKIMLYGYINGLYSSRDIETECRIDINFMFLPEGALPPDHSTFAVNVNIFLYKKWKIIMYNN